jgi:phospholipase C
VFRTVSRASLLAVLSAGAYAAATGCSGSSPVESSPASAENGDQTGTIGLALQTGGVTVDTFAYAIKGPNGYTKNGSIDVSQSTTIAAVIGGIPAANGFTITLTGTATDNTTQCLGTASFNVTAGATSTVTVNVDCHEVQTTGSVLVNGVLNVCPTIQGVSASPSTVLAGSNVSLSASAVDPDNGPSPLTYKWTATSGTFSSATAQNPTFTCTAAGQATITLTVSDGDPSATCAPSQSVTVTCSGHVDSAAELATSTKIKHVVVIFGENISYDHYFGTYPIAQNLTGEPAFSGQVSTPASNNLNTPMDTTKGFAPLTGVDLLNKNPNLNAANGTGASNPFRLSPSQASTADQGHNYKPEQQASDNGLMDLFPEFTGTAGPTPSTPPVVLTKGLVMAYYDGNSVSTLWSWAQTFAMSDNAWTTNFGPSTPGAINLVSGQTNGIVATNKPLAQFSTSHVVSDGNGGFTLIGDTDPLNDVCSTSTEQTQFGGKNIGDLLNAKGITWGWFQGGFDLTVTNTSTNTTGCNRTTAQTVPNPDSISTDYIPHHAPFQYYASTANPTHARPSSVAAIGHSFLADGVTPEPANHNYDTNDFFAALAAGNLPAVVYLKAPAFQDGHAGYSNPVDEGNFIQSVLTALQASQEWSSTVLINNYDDSDGWYDHQAPSIVNVSSGAADALNGTGVCNSGAQQSGAAPTTPLLGNNGMPALGRCGYGTRVPFLVASPYAKSNFIDHTLLDQTSSLRFVEDNWLAGQRIQPGGSFDTIANSITNMLNL